MDKSLKKFSPTALVSAGLSSTLEPGATSGHGSGAGK
jgi:hypothetical protein